MEERLGPTHRPAPKLQQQMERISQLPKPQQRLAEVEDFVDFLRKRENEQRLTQAAARASKASFVALWNNDEDAAYDQVIG